MRLAGAPSASYRRTADGRWSAEELPLRPSELSLARTPAPAAAPSSAAVAPSPSPAPVDLYEEKLARAKTEYAQMMQSMNGAGTSCESIFCEMFFSFFLNHFVFGPPFLPPLSKRKTIRENIKNGVANRPRYHYSTPVIIVPHPPLTP